MSFAAPHWFWALFAVIALLAWRARGARAWCEALALAFLVIALAGPRSAQPSAGGAAPPALRVVLDLSRSMLAADEVPTRWQRAIECLKTRLVREAGRRVGVVAFAGTAWTVAPPTADHAALLELVGELDPLRIADAGSDAGAGVTLALATMVSGEELWLLSDGEWEGSDPAPLLAEASAKGHRIDATPLGRSTPAALPRADPASGGDAVEWSEARPERVSALAAAGTRSGSATTKERWVTGCAWLAFALAVAAHFLGGREP